MQGETLVGGHLIASAQTIERDEVGSVGNSALFTGSSSFCIVHTIETASGTTGKERVGLTFFKVVNALYVAIAAIDVSSFVGSRFDSSSGLGLIYQFDVLAVVLRVGSVNSLAAIVNGKVYILLGSDDQRSATALLGTGGCIVGGSSIDTNLHVGLESLAGKGYRCRLIALVENLSASGFEYSLNLHQVVLDN